MIIPVDVKLVVSSRAICCATGETSALVLPKAFPCFMVFCERVANTFCNFFSLVNVGDASESDVGGVERAVGCGCVWNV